MFMINVLVGKCTIHYIYHTSSVGDLDDRSGTFHNSKQHWEGETVGKFVAKE